MSDRDVNIITKSPPEHYSKSKIKIKENGEEIKLLDDYVGGGVVSADMLNSKTGSENDQFFTKGRHKKLDVYYLSQSHFTLPRQKIRNNTNRKLWFQQTLRDAESMYKDVGGYDMD